MPRMTLMIWWRIDGEFFSKLDSEVCPKLPPLAMCRMPGKAHITLFMSLTLTPDETGVVPSAWPALPAWGDAKF